MIQMNKWLLLAKYCEVTVMLSWTPVAVPPSGQKHPLIQIEDLKLSLNTARL